MIAYWIAFGAHGPRAQPPADENRKVALYTAIGVLISLGLFTTMRAFAGPAPSTINREYEEASNEFLKVSRLRLIRLFLTLFEPLIPLYQYTDAPLPQIEPTCRALHWSLIRGLLRKGSGAITS
jgi:hypothetical protein